MLVRGKVNVSLAPHPIVSVTVQKYFPHKEYTDPKYPALKNMEMQRLHAIQKCRPSMLAIGIN